MHTKRKQRGCGRRGGGGGHACCECISAALLNGGGGDACYEYLREVKLRSKKGVCLL